MGKDQKLRKNEKLKKKITKYSDTFAEDPIEISQNPMTILDSLDKAQTKLAIPSELLLLRLLLRKPEEESGEKKEEEIHRYG